MKNLQTLSLIAFYVTLCACSTTESPIQKVVLQEDTYDAVFEFTHRSTGETFFAGTSNAGLIESVRSELALPIEERTLHVSGAIRWSITEVNEPWEWEFVPEQWLLAEISMELCDGTATYVDENLDKWLEEVGSYCPWSARVSDEVIFAPMTASFLADGGKEYGKCRDALRKPNRPIMLGGQKLNTNLPGNGDLCIEMPADYVIANTYCVAAYGPGRNASIENCFLNQTCQKKGMYRDFRETVNGDKKKVCVNFQRGNYAISPSFYVWGYRP